MRKSQDLVAKSSLETNPPTTGPVLALRTDLDEMLQQHTQDLMDELRSGALTSHLTDPIWGRSTAMPTESSKMIINDRHMSNYSGA
jgi:hypothetical protein